MIRFAQYFDEAKLQQHIEKIDEFATHDPPWTPYIVSEVSKAIATDIRYASHLLYYVFVNYPAVAPYVYAAAKQYATEKEIELPEGLDNLYTRSLEQFHERYVEPPTEEDLWMHIGPLHNEPEKRLRGYELHKEQKPDVFYAEAPFWLVWDFNSTNTEYLTEQFTRESLDQAGVNLYQHFAQHVPLSDVFDKDLEGNLTFWRFWEELHKKEFGNAKVNTLIGNPEVATSPAVEVLRYIYDTVTRIDDAGGEEEVLYGAAIQKYYQEFNHWDVTPQVWGGEGAAFVTTQEVEALTELEKEVKKKKRLDQKPPTEKELQRAALELSKTTAEQFFAAYEPTRGFRSSDVRTVLEDYYIMTRDPKQVSFLKRTAAALEDIAAGNLKDPKAAAEFPGFLTPEQVEKELARRNISITGGAVAFLKETLYATEDLRGVTYFPLWDLGSLKVMAEKMGRSDEDLARAKEVNIPSPFAHSAVRFQSNLLSQYENEMIVGDQTYCIYARVSPYDKEALKKDVARYAPRSHAKNALGFIRLDARMPQTEAKKILAELRKGIKEAEETVVKNEPKAREDPVAMKDMNRAKSTLRKLQAREQRFVRDFGDPPGGLWVASEIQTDVIDKKDIAGSTKNRYAYWSRWLLYELLKEAQREGIKKLWIPAAFDIYRRWKSSTGEPGGKRREEYTIGWQHDYDRNAMAFGAGTLYKEEGLGPMPVFDPVSQDVGYMLDNTLPVSNMWVVDVDQALRILRGEEEEPEVPLAFGSKRIEVLEKRAGEFEDDLEELNGWRDQTPETFDYGRFIGFMQHSVRQRAILDAQAQGAARDAKEHYEENKQRIVQEAFEEYLELVLPRRILQNSTLFNQFAQAAVGHVQEQFGIEINLYPGIGGADLAPEGMGIIPGGDVEVATEETNEFDRLLQERINELREELSRTEDSVEQRKIRRKLELLGGGEETSV